MSDAHRFAGAPPGARSTADLIPRRAALDTSAPVRSWPSEPTTFPTLVVGSLDTQGRTGGPVRTIRRRLVGWAGRNRTDLIVVSALLVVFGLVHGIGMNANPAPVDDEGTYVAQAWSVVTRHALAPYTYWYDHPPFGWILLAGWYWLTHGFRLGQPAVEAGRQFILLTQLVSASLLYLVVRRLALSRPWAVAAVLAWTFSPLAVLYGRQVYLDNVALAWLLGAFALALSPRRSLWALTGAGALMAGAVLCKETFLIFLPALGWQVWQQTDRRTRAFCVTGFLASFALVMVVFPLYALLKGELFPGPGHVSLYDAVRFQLAGRQSSGRILSAGSPAHVLVTGWLSTDPWLLGAGAVMVPVALFVRRLRPFGIAYLIAVLVGLHGGYLPAPYVIAVLPLAAVVATGGVAWLVGAVPFRVVRGAAVAAVLVVVALGAGPAWATTDRTAVSSDGWGSFRQAEAWVEANVGPGSRLLVDDTMWVDLVQHGFNRHLQVVWFHKLGFANNLDPSVARSLPGGWKDFDYVVVTPSMRGAVATDPGHEKEVTDAISHSTVVARFGTGSLEIDIRRIQNGGTR